MLLKQLVLLAVVAAATAAPVSTIVICLVVEGIFRKVNADFHFRQRRIQTQMVSHHLLRRRRTRQFLLRQAEGVMCHHHLRRRIPRSLLRLRDHEEESVMARLRLRLL